MLLLGYINGPIIQDQHNNPMISTLPPQKKKTPQKKAKKLNTIHTAASIRWSSPTQLLISRSEAYLWLSGREAEFSTVCGRMCSNMHYLLLYLHQN